MQENEEMVPVSKVFVDNAVNVLTKAIRVLKVQADATCSDRRRKRLLGNIAKKEALLLAIKSLKEIPNEKTEADNVQA